ncbi:unnamed protein product [Chilo suppressalis]|uniref:Major facilitator superfamily (MFS) profile domain-containing protein n=1 Tax=Chilo suppressalis TaxID=168631 RepID=A0ABN8AZV2_CHISP|nr:unnamed protein product [Chilo suppressalis]
MRDDGNGVVNVKYQNSTKIKNSMAKIEVKTDAACPYSLEPFEIGSDFKVALVAMIQSDIPDIHEHNDTLIIINDTEHLFNKSNIDLMNREAQFEVNGVLNALMLIPPGGWICTVLCRVLQGMTQACIVPGFHTFFGKWTPLEERGRLTAMKSLPVPWKKIFTSTGMLAIIIAHIGNTWGQLTLFTEIPSYMDKVMGVNIKANGLLTALPFLVMWFTNFFFSWITDMLIVKKYLNVTQTRKLANSLGVIARNSSSFIFKLADRQWSLAYSRIHILQNIPEQKTWSACIPSAIGLVALAYAPHNIYIVETILVLICSFKIASTVGFHVNHVDISPNYAGTLMSISNFASNMFGSLAPIVAGIILTDPTDPLLWRKVFFVAAGLYFFTNLVYVIFGTAELAEWNDPPQYDKVALDENKSTKEKTTPTGSV